MSIIRDNLLKELDQVKRDLIQLTQEIGKLDITSDTFKDELRTATAARVCQHLEQNVIPFAKEGAREG